MKIFALVIILLYAIKGISQPVSEYRKYKELAPNAEIVSPNYNIGITLSLQKDKIKVDYTIYEELLYMGNDAKEYSDRSVYSSGFRKLNKVEAYTLVPGEKKYKRIDVEKYTKNTIRQDNVFHDDEEELKFNLLQIDKGSKSVIETSYQITDPHLLPTFSISPYLHYFNATFTLTYPNDIDIAIDTMNMGSVEILHTISKSGDKNISQWKIVASKPFDYEQDGLNASYLAPQIIPRIRSYHLNNINVNVLDNLTNLHKWYSNFITKSEEQSNIFKTLSDSIVQGCNNNIEKASKIYDWVQKNIRYIAFEAGYAGVIPERASLVYQNRYGDCKGMANLLYNLLKAQNIEAYLCWIGTDNLPYKYSKIPSPVVDNHMIAAVTINDSMLFLDPTHSNLAFGMPSPFIQAKEVMVNIKSYEQYKLADVPIIDGDQNLFYDSCSITIQDRNMVGKGLAILTGYVRMDFMDNLNLKDYKSVLSSCRSNLSKGNNNFVLDTVWFSNIDKKNSPLYVWYSFRVPNYAITSEGEQYINLNLDKISLPSIINDNRKLPIKYRYNKSEVNIVSLNFNNDVQTVILPSDTFYKDDIFTFENRYLRSKNQLQRYQKYKRNSLQLYPEQFKSFNQLLEKILKNYQQQVILN
jgi:hypothetical protein